MARIMRAGQKYQKNFPAKKLGGWTKAERAALDWVSEMKQQLPGMHESRYDSMTSRNQSGVVGVYLRKTTMKKPNGNEYEYWSWMARWPGCDKKGGVRFNMNKSVSDEDSFCLAVLARRLKITDKARVFAEYERIKGSKAHKDILKKKLLYLV